MKNMPIIFIVLCQLALVTAVLPSKALASAGHHEAAEEEPEKGPNRGRMLRKDDFAVELAIVETGVPPEFRIWVTKGEQKVDPNKVSIKIELERLGNVIDNINFNAEADYLRGDMEVYEPHSFVVNVSADYQGKSYHWHYDNFEGRSKIAAKVAEAMNIKTDFAGPATLHQTIKVYGKLHLPANAKRQIYARFDGEIQKLNVAFGDKVKKDQVLMTVQSDESLKTYKIKAPVSGIISMQNANSGEQTKGRALLEITSTEKLQARLAVFPMDAEKVKIGAPTTLTLNGMSEPVKGQITDVLPVVREDQARIFWLEIDNSKGEFNAGLYVSALIEIATIDVPLAVKRSGLQNFRDFTVVYAKVGEEYEVRMLELGRKAGQWIEVLGGLVPGTEYVSENSFIIKADIEKSGAAHDH